MQTYDLVGIGFGPSNIALAIALQERDTRMGPLRTLFIEKQASFNWHPHMLLDDTHMQISFLKDLVSLRNPRSRYTFINYLHTKNRLPAFINLKTFFPSRLEFNDYLAWAAGHFEDICAYGEDVFEVAPQGEGGVVQALTVRSRDRHGHIRDRLARNLVISIGGRPRIPDAFAGLREHPAVFHSSTYLHSLAGLPPPKRVAVIGAGQSAAEIFMDLHGRHPDTRVDLISRSRALNPSDDSPFVNEVFNAEFTDYMFQQPGPERAALLEEVWHTNYAVADLALIERIYHVLYQARIHGQERHRYLRRHDIVAARAAGAGVVLTLRDLDLAADAAPPQTYDAVILATGYERDGHRQLLEPVAPYLRDFAVDRQYRLLAQPSFQPGIFLQGACEASHGISDTLLSVNSVRSMEIAQALPDGARQTPFAEPKSAVVNL